MLTNIQDDAMNALLGITQGNMSYAAYTQLFNDFKRSFQQPLIDNLHCALFMRGLADFQLQTHAKSHRSQHKGYNEIETILLTTIPVKTGFCLWAPLCYASLQDSLARGRP
jgi:hypothetical protein